MDDLTEESSQDRDEVADQDLAKQTEEKEPAHEADRKVEEKAVQGAGQEADGEAAEVASSCELTEDTVQAEPAQETDLEAAQTAPCELTEVTGQESAQEVDRQTAQATPCEQAEEAVHGLAHEVGGVTAQQEGKRLAEARQDAAKQELVDRTDEEPKSERNTVQ